jgi:F0F1-type ATP synthase membrane subunit c/vacuolar-type H+-ATPase subunit K
MTESWKLSLAGGIVALAGVAVGATCFGSGPAQAQTAPAAFSRCVIARQESLDTNSAGAIDAPDVSHTILVPAGWEVVGGGGMHDQTWNSAVVLCHR